jgi:hypothetical protein
MSFSDRVPRVAVAQRSKANSLRSQFCPAFDLLVFDSDQSISGLVCTSVGKPAIMDTKGRWTNKMGIFQRKVPTHYIPVHPDNIGKNDWIILLEAGTIVGPSAEKLRVARATLERKVVTKYNIFLRAKHFLALEGYDPRIHTLYFCPQLYAFDADNKLVALEGGEIGELIARAVQKSIVERQPWYEPSDKVAKQTIIATTTDTDFDTLIVDRPVPRASSAATNALVDPTESARRGRQEMPEHQDSITA